MIESFVTEIEKARLLRELIWEGWNIEAEACRVFNKRWASIDEESAAMVPLDRVRIHSGLGLLLSDKAPDDSEWKALLRELEKWHVT